MAIQLKDVLNLITNSVVSSQRDKANDAVQKHVLYALGAGLVPIPVADIAAVSAVQLSMIKRLCEIYHIEYSESASKSLIAAILGSSFARLGASMVKNIPILGAVVGGVSMSVMSGAATYAIGQVFIGHFEANGNLDNFTWEAWKNAYEEYLQIGKDLAARMQQAKPSPNGKATEQDIRHEVVHSELNDMDALIAKLEKLSDLKEKGIITEEEFLNKKQSLLQKM